MPGSSAPPSPGGRRVPAAPDRKKGRGRGGACAAAGDAGKWEGRGRAGGCASAGVADEGGRGGYHQIAPAMDGDRVVDEGAREEWGREKCEGRWKVD